MDNDTELGDAIESLPEDKIKRGKGNSIKYSLLTQEDEFKHHMFPLNIILNPSEKSDWLRSYERYYGNSEEIQVLSDLFRDNITSPVEHYKMATIKLGKNTPSEAVCQIFENVNTNGVQLTVFELLTARFAIENYLLRKEWENKKKNIFNTNLLENIDPVDFLIATTLLTSYLNKKPVTGRKKDILNLSLNDFKNNASLIEDGFKEAEKLLQEERIYNFNDLPYKAQLIPLAVICAIYKLKNELYRYNSRNKIKKWYWNGVFGELYGRSTESRYARDITDMAKWLEDDTFEPRTITDAHFYPQRLLDLKTRRNTAYKGIMALILKNDAKDFISGREMDITTFNDENVDIHHIFPKKYCKDNNLPKEKWDSIVNKTPISQKSNLIIGPRSPKDYLEKIIEENNVPPELIPKILEGHFINHKHLYNNNFDDFFIERAKHILDSIEKATGKKIPDRDNEEIKEIFGGSLI